MLCAWGSALVGWASLNISRSHGDRDMHTIDDFDIVVVKPVLWEGKLCLSSWLLEPLAWFASSLTASAVSCLARSSITVSPARDDSTPNDLVVVSKDRNRHLLGVVRVKSEVSIRWSWIFPEALSDSSSLDAMSSLVTVSVAVASGACWVLSGSGASREAKPHWLIAKIFQLHFSILYMRKWKE